MCQEVPGPDRCSGCEIFVHSCIEHFVITWNLKKVFCNKDGTWRLMDASVHCMVNWMETVVFKQERVTEARQVCQGCVMDGSAFSFFCKSETL